MFTRTYPFSKKKLETRKRGRENADLVHDHTAGSSRTTQWRKNTFKTKKSRIMKGVQGIKNFFQVHLRGRLIIDLVLKLLLYTQPASKKRRADSPVANTAPTYHTIPDVTSVS